MFLRRGIFFLGLLLLLAGIHLAINIRAIDIGYETARLESKFANLQSDWRELNAQAARLKSPARVEMIARSRLDMVGPQKMNYIILKTQ